MITAYDAPVATTDVCPICGSGEFTPLFQVPFPEHSKMPGKGFPLDAQLDVPAWRIVRCHGCTVEYPNPQPTEESIHDYYSEQMEPNQWEIENYVEIPEKARRTWEVFGKRLTGLKGRPGRLLEIGCAAGWLLQGARKAGWEVHGIEASPKFQKYASNVLKLPVQLGTLATADFGDLKFDVVVMTDVIEHLYDPVADLARIRELMTPDGHLLLATCDISSPCARFWGLQWRQIVISHTFYWTKRSMREALHRAGFLLERFSEPRCWHPRPIPEMAARIREMVKLVGRFVLLKTYIPLGERFAWVRNAVRTASAGRLSHQDLLYRIGDQPVFGDVMFVVARPDHAANS
jgi:2-polyprenyl-3-methyl-5-hydroxy-6-metoxy-1,4-benzoquinol methylase